MNLRPLRKLREIPKSVFNLWAVRYRAFSVERYTRFSRGGGDWPKLRPSTLRKRRKGKGLGAVASILWDTGVLVGALSPQGGKPGSLKMFIKNGVRVGYGGSARHKGGMTIAGIAQAHQEGRGALPQRKIIVDPPRSLVDRMAQDVVDHWKRTNR